MQNNNTENPEPGSNEGKPIDLGRYRIHKSSGSEFLTLPKIWVKHNSIRKGDSVDLSMDQDGTLCVRKLRHRNRQAGVV